MLRETKETMTTDAGEDMQSENRQRLLWSCRRGMLELDLLLNGFISKGYESLEPHDRSAFASLLDYPDAVLFDLLMGKSITADQGIASVIKKIRTTTTY